MGYYSCIVIAISSFIIGYIIQKIIKMRRPNIPPEIKRIIEDSTNVVVCVCGVTGSGKTVLK